MIHVEGCAVKYTISDSDFALHSQSVAFFLLVSSAFAACVSCHLCTRWLLFIEALSVYYAFGHVTAAHCMIDCTLVCCSNATCCMVVPG